LAEWAATTTAGTSVIEVDGGHMYLTEHPHALVRLLAAQLAEDAR
jgi:surfactin synthase thioesterase subunit